MLEYDYGKAACLVEYKAEQAMQLQPWHPTVRALIDLGNRAKLPVFVVCYAEDFSWWLAKSLNPWAEDYLPEPQRLSEREWVALLYKIRGQKFPETLFAGEI